MNEPQQQGEREQYRDPQLEELIQELRVISSDLCDLRWVTFRAGERNVLAAESTAKEVSRRLSDLTIAIYKTAPWYLRLYWAWRSWRGNAQLRKIEIEHKRQAVARQRQVQRQMNAGLHTVGRFRSRYL